MLSSRFTRYFGRAIAISGIVLSVAFAAACDDGDGDEPTPVPSATVEAGEPDASPAPTLEVTVDPAVTPGPPVAIELVADPQLLVCDGDQVSNVDALVVDALNHPVADGTDVHFEVVTLGTADPINAVTSGGIAESAVVAVGSQVGVVVNVTSGEAASSIRIDCQ
jgi:hypothetical protein